MCAADDDRLFLTKCVDISIDSKKYVGEVGIIIYFATAEITNTVRTDVLRSFFLVSMNTEKRDIDIR